MDLRRTLKVLRAKWWVVLLTAVVGGLMAAMIASAYNDGISPSWKAEAPVSFIQITVPDETAAGAATTIDLDDEVVRAQLRLEEKLLANPNLSITVDDDTNTLLFTATGSDGTETLEEAVRLRAEYQQTGVTALSPELINEAMANLLADISAIDLEIASLEIVEPDPEDPAIASERLVLEAQVAALNQRQAQVRIWIANPELRPTTEGFLKTKPSRVIEPVASPGDPVVATIVSITELGDEATSNDIVLTRLRGDLERLPASSTSEVLAPEKALELEALQLQKAELGGQYVGLLRVRDASPLGGFIIEPIVTDQTRSEVPVGIAGLIGFVVIGLISATAVIMLDTSRQHIWSVSDLENVVSLGLVDRDRTDGATGALWFPTALSQRRRDIQILRSATDAVTQEAPAVVGLTGIDVDDSDIGELAADLAMAIAVTGRSVLLIDANAFSPNLLPEFGDRSSGLSNLLTKPMTPQNAAVAITAMLDKREPVAPGLTSIRVDAGSTDPIDAFASPNYRQLIAIARDRYDIVIVAGPGLADPLSDAVVRRNDYLIVAGLVGTTTLPRITTATETLEDRRVQLAGVALLEGRRQPITSEVRGVFRGEAPSWASKPTRFIARTIERMRSSDADVHTEPEHAPDVEPSMVDAAKSPNGKAPQVSAPPAPPTPDRPAVQAARPAATKSVATKQQAAPAKTPKSGQSQTSSARTKKASNPAGAKPPQGKKTTAATPKKSDTASDSQSKAVANGDSPSRTKTNASKKSSEEAPIILAVDIVDGVPEKTKTSTSDT